MIYPLYLLILSIAPGIIWLLYFLRKDVHPEPKRMILTVFFLGMVAALPAIGIELLFQKLPLGKIVFSGASLNYVFLFLQATIGVAFIEELMKYLVVRFEVLRNPEMDEPMDVILYMIISALGFATLENILIFFSPDFFSSIFLSLPLDEILKETLALSLFRFISATFLHALASGTIGFFMALSFYEIKNKKLLFFMGFAIATLLHGLYNFSIMNLKGDLKFGIPLAVITALAIFIYFGIKYLKSKKSICKVE